MQLDDAKEALDGMMRAFEEFKETNDTRLAEIERKGGPDPVVTEKLGRIEKTLDGFEKLNQKLTLAEQQAKAAKERGDEIKAGLEKIELRLNRPGVGGGDALVQMKQYYQDWAYGVTHALALGEPNLNELQRKAIERARAECKAMTVSNDPTGGYLAPPEFSREILKAITEISPMRSIVRVRQTANRSIMLPKRTGRASAQWVSEQGTRVETPGLTWGMDEIPTHEHYSLIDISHQNLEDSAYDLEGEIRREAQEQFAIAEGQAVLSGNGVGKPFGLLTAAGVTTVNSGTSATIADANGQANGIIDLYHAIKTDYTRNAVFLLNRQTLGAARKLQDTSRQYIWMPGLANAAPNTILGVPYIEVPDMPNQASNAYSIAFGDFGRAYVLVDRVAMQMLRDPYTQATGGNIRFLFYRRIGGQVIMPEAYALLKCST